MSEYQRILVTSALPYANGPIHLGHMAGAYLPADVFVRYQRLKKQDVIFISGTDEHGVPIRIAADQARSTPMAVVQKYHKEHAEVFHQFGISFDNFSGTARPIHVETSQDIFLKLYHNGYFQRKSVQQFYCENCDRFLPDRYVEGICPKCQAEGARGDQCEKCGSSLDQIELSDPHCKVCGRAPVLRVTDHLFFKLGEFQDALQKWLGEKKDWKENVLNYCNGWFREKLADRAITRDLDWGVPVPLDGYEGKVLYVWFEAPIGYISSTKEWAVRQGDAELWKKYWLDPGTRLIHFIGKDNIVFHAIIWPAVLMAYGTFVLPDNIPANEFLNLEGAKFSTSRNYAVWLHEYLEKFPPDPLRYWLSVEAPENKDSDFSWRGLQAHNNSELADILGNFINRSLTFIQRNFAGQVPVAGELNAGDKDMLAQIQSAPARIGELFDHFELRKAAFEFINVARIANKYFNDQEPWNTLKTDLARCATTLNVCVQVTRALAILMHPILPFSSEKVWKMLNLPGAVGQEDWDQAGQAIISAGHALGEIQILFPKIEDEKIEPEIQYLQSIALKISQKESEAEKKMTTPVKETVSFEDFQKLDLRVARILAAERIPQTEKLLKLKIDIGPEERQIVAGIAKNYDPQQLIGRKIVVVANLAPAKIRGQESRGMLLAAIGEDGSAHLLSTDDEISIGARIS